MDIRGQLSFGDHVTWCDQIIVENISPQVNRGHFHLVSGLFLTSCGLETLMLLRGSLTNIIIYFLRLFWTFVFTGNNIIERSSDHYRLKNNLIT